jgi:hypothetical protein
MARYDFRPLQELAQKLWKDEPIPDELQPIIERLTAETYVERELMTLIHEWLDSQRLFRKSGRIIAPPGTGKTVICEGYYLLNRPQKRLGRRDIVPVLYLEAPANCSVSDLLVLILETLNGDSVGQATYLRKRALDLLKASKVEMILFDEANLMKIDALGELARIFNQLKISIILVGTEELNNLVTRKEYIHDRFKKCYRFKVLTSGEFNLMLETLEEEILQLPVPSNLAVEEISEKLFLKTGGKIRHLDWILREAAIFSLRKGFKQVDKATLEDILERFE